MTDFVQEQSSTRAMRAFEGGHSGPADLRAVLSSIGETIYTWDVATDRILWGGNAASTLRAPSTDPIASGRSYARLVVAGSGGSRYDAVMRATERDAGHGVPFQTHYAFRAPDGTTLWLEDTGRWFAGLDGSPVRVHGAVRVVPAPSRGATGHAPQSDALTGALTRQQLTELLDDEIVRARKQHKSLGLALAGIEHLADYNEAYGFDVADQVIAGVAQRLRQVMRRGDSMARHSGNKLAIVLLGCAEEQLPIAAARFIEAVKAEPIQTACGPIAASIRLGAVLLPRFGSTSTQALQHAEEALGDAKTSLDQNFRTFAPDRRRDERRQSNRRFTDEIVAALNDRRVAIARQPVVAGGGRTLAFEEALVRVRREDGSTMPAAQIVPMIEKLGFVPLLDHRVFELVCSALAAEPGATLSMNVSPMTLCRQEWLDALRARLGSDTAVARRLIVELTETSVIEELETARRTVAAMRELGLRVAIDDFGSGHTSFRHLRDLGIDLVKIDGAFVQNVGRSTDDRFFVRTLVDLARHLGVGIVAEWVQDEETARLLESWGVDYLQGELFGEAALPGAAGRRLAAAG